MDQRQISKTEGAPRDYEDPDENLDPASLNALEDRSGRGVLQDIPAYLPHGAGKGPLDNDYEYHDVGRLDYQLDQDMYDDDYEDDYDDDYY